MGIYEEEIMSEPPNESARSRKGVHNVSNDVGTPTISAGEEAARSGLDAMIAAQAGSSPAPAPAPVPEVLIPKGFTIPGAPRPPRRDLSRSAIWIYGEPKIGKTTLAASFPGVWFLSTEKGQDWVDTREPTVIQSWSHFLEFMGWFVGNNITRFADGEPIHSFGIDTIDGLFKMCFDDVCASMGVQDPGEIPHGGGWSKLDREWSRVMSKVHRLPLGLIYISHARQKEFKSRGISRHRNEPYIGAAGFRWCTSTADLILYCYPDAYAETNSKGEVTGRIITKRRMLVHPRDDAVAGGRMVGKMEIPEILDLDYKELVKYFPDTPQKA